MISKQLISGTGLVITHHALKRWRERFNDEFIMFGLEASLHSAVKRSGKGMYDFKGKCKIHSRCTTFVLNNRTVLTCHAVDENI